MCTKKETNVSPGGATYSLSSDYTCYITFEIYMYDGSAWGFINGISNKVLRTNLGKFRNTNASSSMTYNSSTNSITIPYFYTRYTLDFFIIGCA